ncbi:MAG: hypothetical protein C4523_09470 [Myxococcales bacterium]|nr:MAG: hypothetical protein C4523_09470 [Myxococcales bacterium]
MSVLFHSQAVYMGPCHWRLPFTLSGTTAVKLGQEFGDSTKWTLQKYDADAGTWDAVTGQIFGFVQTDVTRAHMDIAFHDLDGLYRLVCTAADVDTDHDTIYLRDQHSAHEPYHLRIEGVPYVLPYLYVDQESLPDGVSQKLELRDGITDDSSVTLGLVDYDGFLTGLFNPGATTPVTALEQALSDSEISVMYAVDTTDFPAAGYLWVDNECIHYSLAAPGGFLSLLRGQCESAADSHAVGAAVFGYLPNLRGRIAWLEDGSDAVIWTGVIDSLTPGENLAAYSLSMADPKTLLDAKIGYKLGSGQVARTFLVTERDNRFLIDYRLKGGVVEGSVPMSLTPGVYDITPVAQGAPVGPTDTNRLRVALKNAINDAIAAEETDSGRDLLARCEGVWIGDDSKLSIKMSFVLDALYFIPHSEYDLLARLGFEKKIDFQEPEGGETFSNGRKKATKDADNALGGTGPNSTVIPVNPSPDSLDGATTFATAGYARIDDEIIYHSGLDVGEDWDAELNGNMSVDQEHLLYRDAMGTINTDDLVQIDDEILYVKYPPSGPSAPTGSLTIVRGANGTTAATHLDGATILKLPYTKLTGCTRGLCGTEREAHEGGTEVREIVVSDQTGQTSLKPFIFLRNLLNSDQGYSLDLPSAVADLEGIAAAGERGLGADAASFLAILEDDVTFRDAAAMICKSLGYWLYVNAAGQIAVGRFHPKLAHQGADFTYAPTQILLSAPYGVAWDEAGRLNRVVVSCDRDASEDDYKLELRLNDNRLPSKAWRHSDHTYELETDYFHSSLSRTRQGNYDVTARELALTLFERFGCFLAAPRIGVAASQASGIEIGSIVSLTAPGLPNGAGTRGLTGIFHVVEHRRDFQQGMVELGLLGGVQEGRGFNVSLIVAGWDGENNTLTVRKGGYWPDGVNPDELIQSGDTLALMQFTGGVFARGTAVVSVVAGSWSSTDDHAAECAIEMDSGFSGPLTPAVGDTITCGDYDDSYAESPPDAENSVLKLLAFIADTDGKLGAADDGGYNYTNEV